jgi:hypothetical protein
VAPLIHILGYDGLATAILDAIAIVFCIHARITQDATLSIQSVDASHSHIGPADTQVAASHSAVTPSSSPASGNNAELLRLVPSGEKEAGQDSRLMSVMGHEQTNSEPSGPSALHT